MPSHDIFAALRTRVVDALAALLPELPPEAFARVLVEPPRDPSHGDMATNGALVVGKAAKQAPPKLAAALAEKLAALPEVESASPAGPGFVNLRLRESFLRAQLPVILDAAERYGDGATGAGRRVDVEYVSANPTGPMHVGHCRGAVVGDALANLLAKAGYDVTKEYYINDAGAQVQALGYAAYWRYLQALGTRMTEEEYAQLVPGGLQYRGEYLIPVGEALRERFGDSLATRDEIHGIGMAGPDHWLATVREFTVARMMEAIREDLAALGVVQDVFISEAQLVREGKLEQAEALLAAKDLIYRGVLEPPKGKTPEDWEPREQTLFRATQFGDEVDRPLRKSDGSGTYFANDIANHLHKIERGFDELVHVWGADHGGYVKRMQAAVAALSDKRVPLDVVLTQIVHVVKDGQPVRMSKRAGTYITLRDLIDEVGRDAVRFTMLTRKSDAQMEFDLDKVVEQSRDNPVFYVQYAHARCRSVLRQAEDPAPGSLAEAPLEVLTDAAELALIRRLVQWPRTVEAAALAREPHRIAFFLHDLASDFHVLWNRGREDTTLRFIRAEEPEATRARLALVAATATVIRSGLAVMGVTPVEEMR
ncbi:arginine--tRNA ligase [Siccirubricoccus sp. KC 17139]|uniref:Arginine--tRNA ligase n=1 Tax=Siccirubricoccus soli TaxID=2899147 RepID=A0ABT1DDJ9_9PROT|nr:arginine--tRNA ligase [Siccirubricoccus soli]MCO6420018.1 arginine--tRNA ligase [Siccirubricoccus soli]MCP2686155.1 arginine--tRNA ligase [Siccirubricoccus soli]